MPYISHNRKDEIYGGAKPESSGELNYLLTTVIQAYLYDQGKSYRTMNEIVGALESCKLEFYARVARPYEDKKISENGDVY